MSLFGGTDCSANGNAIAQLNKHTQQDRSLQRQTNGLGAVINQGFKNDKMMNQRDLDQFMVAGNQPQNTFQFQPMRHELNAMSRSSSSQQNWLQDFKAHAHSPVPQAAHISAQRSGNHQWASEFQSSSPQQSQFQSQPQSQQQNRMPMSMMGGGYRPMMGMSSMAPMRNVSQSTQKEEVSVDWDNRFKEIEELSDVAHASAEAAAKEGEQMGEDIVIDDKYQANFQEVWDLLNLDLIENDFITQQYEDFKRSQDRTFPADMPQWEKDFAKYASTRANFGEYKFEVEEQNQFMDLPVEHDAYEIGLQLMENGAKLSEAALAFEAAIHKDSNRVEAWLKLGEVQTQNEKEIAGISALEKCLDLHPENSEALMTLAISYINEGYDNAAFATLERWISTKYPQVAEKARQQNQNITDEDRFTLNKRVTELFMNAAQLSPDQASMDADVQMGLGVLFYAQEDFDKTIDCFKAALSIRPDDPLLWNRLGASLANLNRSEEAVDAYFKALELKPTFVRARYNLGVSCINIGCYKEAAEHLLSGLAMHEVEGQETTLNQNQSSSLMETLKRAFIALERRDLVELVRPGMDLNQFRGEFNF
ncbi:peroxisomal targeting signal receptor [Metschnikowia bicuspidata var. bicuspidata NRRL YB-4993]|uniref:Peroxisomal targeting signal receptor n=1 Tax=Metschnikowia bicuspidata var. bicuspidata NRRL YB-4993 TaxID=869754 RepID=A0A1A0HIL6_9ASCO|nr:peroxisomal targeting signal receptor [Metschnikowia bicuspidata var. bicuspidata NRRL YB-4993]OBA23683.1 peroxisomal targeting signal receptor [Metschnikowia bicuspidata var. bicuspidata NRRL YB-4993]